MTEKVETVKNNAFGMFIEAWGSFMFQGYGYVSYPTLLAEILPSAPSESATSRIKTIQPMDRTLARFIEESSTGLDLEQDLLIPGRKQPRLKPDADLGDVREYVWEALSVMVDRGSFDEEEGVEKSLLSVVVRSSYGRNRFRSDFCDQIMKGLTDYVGADSMLKLSGHIAQLNDSNRYGRFEIFAALFFASLTGEEGIDAIVADGLPNRARFFVGTPLVDGRAMSEAVVECGYTLTQVGVGPRSRICDLKTWSIGAEQSCVTIGRDGPDVVLLPPVDPSWAVSRQHARIHSDGAGSYWVEDDSLNGTVVTNASGINLLRHDKARIYDGDLLLLAPIRSTHGKTSTMDANWERGSVVRFNIQYRLAD